MCQPFMRFPDVLDFLSRAVSHVKKKSQNADYSIVIYLMIEQYRYGYANYNVQQQHTRNLNEVYVFACVRVFLSLPHPNPSPPAPLTPQKKKKLPKSNDMTMDTFQQICLLAASNMRLPEVYNPFQDEDEEKNLNQYRQKVSHLFKVSI